MKPKIGQYNTLTVARIVDFGAYLTAGGNNTSDDVLLPAKYFTDVPEVGDEMKVFVYNDSENRPIATTLHPFATVGEVAFLQVKAVTSVGAFLEWGLPKDLLVPFSEQKVKMLSGGVYPVYVYLDNASGRIVASAKLEKYIGNKYPEVAPSDKVKALVLSHNEIGYRCVVDNLYWGMIYENEIFRPLEVGVAIEAWVKSLREDGKIDLAVSPRGMERIERLSEEIARLLEENGGRLPVGDSSSPELIRDLFKCSKKDFKKAAGVLYKAQRAIISGDHIQLI